MCICPFSNPLSEVTNSVKRWKKHEHMRGYETPDLYPSAVLVSPTLTYSVTKCAGTVWADLKKGHFMFFARQWLNVGSVKSWLR